MNVHAEDSMLTRTLYLYISMHVYIAYVNQESMWSLNGSTYQRKYLATSKVFAGSMCKSIYILQIFRSQNGSVKALNFHIIIP